jgi:hypothetical protein
MKVAPIADGPLNPGLASMTLFFSRQIRGWDLRRNVVNFVAEDDGAPDIPVACAISMEALIEHFGARNSGKQACLTAFDRWRTAIEQKASEKHATQATKGSILLRKSDFD